MKQTTLMSSEDPGETTTTEHADHVLPPFFNLLHFFFYGCFLNLLLLVYVAINKKSYMGSIQEKHTMEPMGDLISEVTENFGREAQTSKFPLVLWLDKYHQKGKMML